MNKLIQKYYSLRQQYWTHILLPFTYIFLSCLIYGTKTYIEYGVYSDIIPLMYYLIGLFLYFCGMIFATIVSIINFALDNKIKNKFVLYNKFYGIIWHSGNIASVLIITVLIIVLIIINILFILDKLNML